MSETGSSPNEKPSYQKRPAGDHDESSDAQKPKRCRGEAIEETEKDTSSTDVGAIGSSFTSASLLADGGTVAAPLDAQNPPAAPVSVPPANLLALQHLSPENLLALQQQIARAALPVETVNAQSTMYMDPAFVSLLQQSAALQALQSGGANPAIAQIQQLLMLYPQLAQPVVQVPQFHAASLSQGPGAFPTTLSLLAQQVSSAFPPMATVPASLATSSNPLSRSGPNQPVGLTGRPPVVLSLDSDRGSLSEYQCLARKQIEFFEAQQEDVDSNAQGRNRPIVLAQVGIRCRHCISLPSRLRGRAAIYFPTRLDGIYQAAQNMIAIHLCDQCACIAVETRVELTTLKARKSSAGGGKKYWGDGARKLGVIEDTHIGLRFENR